MLSKRKTMALEAKVKNQREYIDQLRSNNDKILEALCNKSEEIDALKKLLDKAKPKPKMVKKFEVVIDLENGSSRWVNVIADSREELIADIMGIIECKEDVILRLDGLGVRNKKIVSFTVSVGSEVEDDSNG